MLIFQQVTRKVKWGRCGGSEGPVRLAAETLILDRYGPARDRSPPSYGGRENTDGA